MFHSDISGDENTLPNDQHDKKKRKLDAPFKPNLIHSSLKYTSVKAPPLVEYNSIDSYCEKNLGKSLLPSHDATSQPTFDIQKVSSISSPVVLKSPNKSTVNSSGCLSTSSGYVPPYSFFTVEELSMVKCLSNWTNTKVCPVGRVEFDIVSKECYFHSVSEKGSWKVLLDHSLLNEIPQLKTVLQIFGCLEVVEGKPVVKGHFYRNLGSTDLNLLVTSYRMMQKHIPDFLDFPKCYSREESSNPQVLDASVGCELNDTFDGYDLSAIEKGIDFEEN